MSEIYVVIAENDMPHNMRNRKFVDPDGPIVFEQYTNKASLEEIRERAAQLSLSYGKCKIAKLELTGEEFENGKPFSGEEK